MDGERCSSEHGTATGDEYGAKKATSGEVRLTRSSGLKLQMIERGGDDYFRDKSEKWWISWREEEEEEEEEEVVEEVGKDAASVMKREKANIKVVRG